MPAEGDDVVLVTVPVQHAAILRRLATDAAKGNVQSARELREWRRQYPEDDQTVDLGGVDQALRKRILRVLTYLCEDADRWDALQEWMISLHSAGMRTD